MSETDSELRHRLALEMCGITVTDEMLATELRTAHADLRAVTLEKLEIIKSQLRRYEACLKRATDAGLDVTETGKTDYGRAIGLAMILRDRLRSFEDPDAPLPETSALTIRRVTITDL